MKKRPLKDQMVRTRVTSSMKADVAALAAAREVEESDVVRDALRFYLKLPANAIPPPFNSLAEMTVAQVLHKPGPASSPGASPISAKTPAAPAQKEGRTPRRGRH